MSTWCLIAAAGLSFAALVPGWFLVRARWLLGTRTRRRDELAAAEALPGVARRLGAEVGAGRTLVRALRAAAVDAPPPLDSALAETSARLASGGRAGGDLPRLLRTLASALDDRAQVDAELRALTAQARFSAVVVPLLPLGALGILALAEPRGVRLLLTTEIGLLVIGIAAVLDVVGALLIRRLLVPRV
jgi:tight adherence protein B